MSAALSRLERILAMVPWLLAHPGATLDEIAARFATTREQVVADLDVLGYCGVPGYGGGDLIEVAIDGSRVDVRMADYFRRPLRFELREAVTLLLAGRLLLDVPGIADDAALRRAVGRLEEALGAVEVAVDLQAPDGALLTVLQDAVTRGRVLSLRYRSAHDETERERLVEPWAVLVAGGAWYLRGYCRRARDRRDFRVDRIRSAAATDERVPTGPREQRPEPPAYRPSPEDLQVVLDLDEPAAWLADALPGAAWDDRGRLTVSARSHEWAARLVLSLGGAARVVAPTAVAARVRTLAAATRERYAGPPEHPANRG